MRPPSPKRMALIPAALLALLLIPSGAYSATDPATGYRLLVVVGSNSTIVGPGLLAEPLTLLTKIDCGGAIAAVYGYKSGEPLIVAIYVNTSLYGSKALSAALSCPKRLLPCLSAAGAGYIAKQLEEAILNYNVASVNETLVQHGHVSRCTPGPSLLLAGIVGALVAGLAAGYIIARQRGPRHRAAS